jgi:hypothetical protein
MDACQRRAGFFFFYEPPVLGWFTQATLPPTPHPRILDQLAAAYPPPPSDPAPEKSEKISWKAGEIRKITV